MGQPSIGDEFRVRQVLHEAECHWIADVAVAVSSRYGDNACTLGEFLSQLVAVGHLAERCLLDGSWPHLDDRFGESR